MALSFSGLSEEEPLGKRLRTHEVSSSTRVSFLYYGREDWKKGSPRFPMSVRRLIFLGMFTKCMCLVSSITRVHAFYFVLVSSSFGNLFCSTIRSLSITHGTITIIK